MRISITLVLGALLLCAAPVLALDPFFTEYVEGTSNNKALEVYNPGPGLLDLGGYSILIYYNGSATPATTVALSAATLAPGDVWVVTNTLATATLLALADQTHANINFNGDDAVVLRRNSDSAFMDVIGQIGFDPGSEWGTGITSTADNTLRRFQGPDTLGNDVFDPAQQWLGYAVDTFGGLGVPESPIPNEGDSWGGVKTLYR